MLDLYLDMCRGIDRKVEESRIFRICFDFLLFLLAISFVAVIASVVGVLSNEEKWRTVLFLSYGASGALLMIFFLVIGRATSFGETAQRRMEIEQLLSQSRDFSTSSFSHHPTTTFVDVLEKKKRAEKEWLQNATSRELAERARRSYQRFGIKLPD